MTEYDDREGVGIDAVVLEIGCLVCDLLLEREGRTDAVMVAGEGVESDRA